MVAFEENDTNNCIDPSPLSEHDSGEERLSMKLPRKLQSENTESSESNRDNMKPEGDEDEHYNADSSLRNAYRIFLEDSVVAAVAGIFINSFVIFYRSF